MSRSLSVFIALLAVALGATSVSPSETGRDAFFRALAERESNGDYGATNELGYLGAYQFGEAALVDLGFYVPDGTPDNDWIGTWTGLCGIYGKADLLARSDVQDAAMAAWADKLWTYSTHAEFSLDRYVGQNVAGMRITPTAIIAGAHIVGIWGVAAFLRSGGAENPTDPFGVHVSEYIATFAPYELHWLHRDGATPDAAGVKCP